MLSQTQLKAHIHYDPATGIFRWQIDTDSRRAGSIAGSRRSYSYVITIARKCYQAHQLAWLYMTGEWHTGRIGHTNGDNADNRWSNLFAGATCRVRRARPNANSTTGLRGVSYNRSRERFQATISLKGRQTHLGFYSSMEEARDAYALVAALEYGELKNIRGAEVKP